MQPQPRGDKGLPVQDSLVVRGTSDQGLEGWGEAFGFSCGHIGKIGNGRAANLRIDMPWQKKLWLLLMK